MKSELISSENVRPSSPTPQDLKTYTVSLLDQIIPHIHVPLLLFFPNTTNTNDLHSFISETSQQLKTSLSVTLTRYYTFAGRLNHDGRYVDCNDEGVPFVVAKFKGHKLCDLLRNPLKNSPQYFISELVNPDMFNVALKVQVNYFNCGGFVIGALFSHRLADGMTMATFMQSWASTARGSKEAVCPSYIASSMFPPSPKEEIPILYGMGEANIARIGKPMIKRYVFNASAISTLKCKSGVERPTRVEVVSSLILKCLMVASLARNFPISLVTHSVNLRARSKPPIPSQCFGNLVGFSMLTRRNEHDKELGELVREVRGAISKIDDEFIDRMKGKRGFSGYLKNVEVVMGNIGEGAVGVGALAISSWCRFGIYNADFGWGKPIWVSGYEAKFGPDSGFVNMVWLMDTRNGHGIEAWVVLDEKDVSAFENVDELRNLASIDPSPLDM
ncbi:hypothetical protein ACS0TY_036628 [Phlomoides rotata]